MSWFKSIFSEKVWVKSWVKPIPGKSTWAVRWFDSFPGEKNQTLLLVVSRKTYYFNRISRHSAGPSFENVDWALKSKTNLSIHSSQSSESASIQNRCVWFESRADLNHFLRNLLESRVEFIQFLVKPLELWVKSIQNFDKGSWSESNKAELYRSLPACPVLSRTIRLPLYN